MPDHFWPLAAVFGVTGALMLWNRATDMRSVGLFLFSAGPAVIWGQFLAYWSAPAKLAGLKGFVRFMLTEICAAVVILTFVSAMAAGALLTSTPLGRPRTMIAILVSGYAVIVLFYLESLLFVLGE